MAVESTTWIGTMIYASNGLETEVQTPNGGGDPCCHSCACCEHWTLLISEFTYANTAERTKMLLHLQLDERPARCPNPRKTKMPTPSLIVKQKLDECPSHHNAIVRLPCPVHVFLKVFVTENSHRMPYPQQLDHDLLVEFGMALHRDDVALLIHALDTAQWA